MVSNHFHHWLIDDVAATWESLKNQKQHATGTTEAAVKQRIYRLKQQLKELNKKNSEYEE